MDVVVAETIDAVESLRDSWKAAAPDVIDSDIDFYLTVVRNAPGVHQPYVVRIRRPGHADLFGIARVEDLPMAMAIGYRTLMRPALRAVVVTFGGLVGAASPEDEQLLLDALNRPLRSGRAEALLLRTLDIRGIRYELASRLAGGLLRVRGRAVSRRWTADIPDSFDDFLGRRSAKTRQKLRWQCRKLERDYGQDLRLRRFDRPEEFDDLCAGLEAVAAKAYQRGIGAGYHGNALDHALIRLGLEMGWFRAWILYIGDAPVAFWIGNTYLGTFSTGTPGFDPAYTRESVGRYTMLRMIEDLCADDRVSRLDFGHGEAEYKEAFGAATAVETDVLVLAPRPRPVLVGVAASAFAGVNGWGQRFARESPWGRRLKRAWRRRLSARGSAPASTAETN